VADEQGPTETLREQIATFIYDTPWTGTLESYLPAADAIIAHVQRRIADALWDNPDVGSGVCRFVENLDLGGSRG
jgi:hypothetical protein